MNIPRSFQDRVRDWMNATFTKDIVEDKTERNHRFLEEALELVQACNGTQAEAHMLVDYVFNRSRGERAQEVGGVMVTLAALCNANHLRMIDSGNVELERCWKNIAKIREKQLSKPLHSPLPE